MSVDKASKATSATLTLIISGNVSPQLTIFSPAPQTTFAPPANVEMGANASDPDGTVSFVEFRVQDRGTGSVVFTGSDTTSPYVVTAAGLGVGSYRIIARAIDNDGAATEVLRDFSVVLPNRPPTVSLVSPTGGTFLVPGTIRLEANASDPDASDTVTVQFFADGQAISTPLNAPYRFDWTPPIPSQPRTYAVTARASDGRSTTTSAPAVSITVVENRAPTVGLAVDTAWPALSPGRVVLNATVTEPDGQAISRVEFFRVVNGQEQLIGIATAPAQPNPPAQPSPVRYSVAWSNPPVATHALIARAFDTAPTPRAGTSTAINLAVAANRSPSGIAVSRPFPGQNCPSSSNFDYSGNQRIGPAAGPLTVEAKVADPDADVERVEFYQFTPNRISLSNGANLAQQLAAMATGAHGAPQTRKIATAFAPAAGQTTFTTQVNATALNWSNFMSGIYAVAFDSGGQAINTSLVDTAAPPLAFIGGCTTSWTYWRWAPIAYTPVLVPPGFGNACSVDPANPGQCASAPHQVPGRIEAERYNQGGQGIGYFEVDPFTFTGETMPSRPRNDDVDLRECTGASLAPGCVVGRISPGEWLKYTLHFTQGGQYRLLACFRPVGSVQAAQRSDSKDPLALEVETVGENGWVYSSRVVEMQPVSQAAPELQQQVERSVASSSCSGGTELHYGSVGVFPTGFRSDMRVRFGNTVTESMNELDWFQLDLIGPESFTVGFVSPANGDTVAVGTTARLPIVAGVSSSNGSTAGIAVEFQVRRPGAAGFTPFQTVAAAPFAAEFPPVGGSVAGFTEPGDYQFRAIARAGTVAVESLVTVVASDNPGNQVPVVTLVPPPNGGVVDTGSTVTFAADARDPDGSILEVEFLRNGAPFSPRLLGVRQGASDRFTASWTAGMQPETFRLSALAVDNRSEVGTAAMGQDVVVATPGPGGTGIASAPPPSYASAPAQDPNSAVVAATRGEFRVDESGAATYTIPLAMAPGLGGVVPQLSLNYSSGGGEGMLGVGWSVSGLQAIARCRKSFEAGDAYSVANAGNTEVTELGHKPLRFFPVSGTVDPDPFCLNGQRLLRIDDAGSAAHGLVGARYRTELDDFTDIAIVDDGDPASFNAGPEQFRVERKDGSVLTFGSLQARNAFGQQGATNARLPLNVASGPTASSLRTESGRGAVMTWALSRMEDRLGNAIHYFYEYPGGDAAAGEQYIKEIHYTVPGAASSLSPRSRVVFQYATVAADVSFVSGMKLQRSRRLERIDVFNDTALVRSYRLAYDGPASMSGRDRLTSIQECADAAGAVCYPRTRFDWTDAVLGVASNAAVTTPNEVHVVQPPGGGEPAPHAIKYGDINGDGLTDLVWARNEPNSEDQVICWAIAQSTAFGFSTACNNVLRLYQRRETDGNMYTVASSLAFHLYDFSGDGRDDLLIAEKDESAWNIYVSDGLGFSAPRTSAKAAGISLGGTGEVQLADFNGDGLLDAVYGVGPGTGGVGSGGSGGTGPCPRCLPNRPAETAPGTSAPTSTVFRGLSDPASGVRPVISYMATSGVGGVACSSGLKYCFSQGGTVGGLAASSLPALVGHNTACGTASNQQNALGAAVRFDGGIEVLDFDGDGVNDLVAKAVPGNACQSTVPAAWVVYRNVGWALDPNNPAAGPRHTFARVFAQNVGSGDSNGAPNVDTGAQIGWRPVETNDHRFVTGDVNGDGLTDLLYRGNSGGIATWYYRLNTGRVSGATLPGGQPADGLALAFGPAVALPALSASGVAEKTVTVADLTGDGGAEVVYGVDVSGYREYRAVSWTGTGFPASPIVLTNVISTRGQNSERSVFVDLDGDGRPEQVVADYQDHTPGNGEIILRRAFPGTEGTASRRHLPADHVHRIVDGFGATTSIRYSPLTVLGTYLPGRSSAGRAAEFGRGSNVFDLRHAQYVVREVASSAPRFDDATAVSRVAYRYRGARMQMGGRGFLGFEEVQTLDLQSLVEASTTYGQSFPLVGLPISTWSRALDPASFPASGWGSGSGTSITLACRDNPSGSSCFGFRADSTSDRSWPAAPQSAGLMMSSSSDRYGFVGRGAGGYAAPINTSATPSLPAASTSPQPLFRFKASSETSTYDLGPTKTQIEELRNETYDAHGNVLRLVARRKDGAGTTLREAVTDNTYGTSATHQRFGRLGETTVTTTAGGQSKTRRAAFRYHEPSLLLRGEIVEPTGSADRALVTTHQYNAYGNKTHSATCSAHHLPGAVSNGNVVVDTAVAQCELTGAASVFFTGSDVQVRRYARTTFATNDPRYVVSEQAPFATSTGPATEQTTTVYLGVRDRFGNPAEVSELNGLRTRFGYDAFGAKFFESTNTGASTRTVRRFCSTTFDGGSARWGAVTPPQVAACPAGAVVRVDTFSAGAPDQTVFLDVLGREMRSVTPGFRTTQFVVTDTRYDEMGRLARKSVPVILASALGTVPSTHFAETHYDVAGRVVRLVTPDSNVPGGRAETTTTYSGLTTTVTMPANVSGFSATREERRNALGEIIQSKDGTGLRACYAYDAHGNLSKVWRNETADCEATPPASVLTSVDYDDLGRKTRMVDLDKGTWQYRYNAAGEVIREITARNQCIESRYDARGRVVTRTDRTAAGATVDVACGGTIESESTWAYDSGPNGFGQPFKELVSTTDPLGTAGPQLLQEKTFAYDAFGRARSTTTRMLPNTPGERSYTSSRTYDEFGRLFQDLFTSPEFAISGALYEYTDSFPGGAQDDDPNLTEGYLRKVRDATGQRRGLAWHETVNVDAFGTVVEERRGESDVLRTLRTTDDRTGRLATIRTHGGQLQNWAVQWDGAGNVRSRSNSAAGASPGETFAYDRANRLLGVTATGGSSTESYGYSLTGNLTSRAGGTISYGNTRPAACLALPAPGPHAANAFVLGANTICYTYDASGNQVSAAGGGVNRTVLYSVADQARRMDSTIDNLGSRLAFEYGAGRERIRRRDYPTVTATTANSETHYVGGAEVFLTPANNCGSTRNVLVRREYAGAVLLQRNTCASNVSTPSTSLAYRLVDHLGSTDALVTAAGLPVDSPAQQRFDAFGARRDATTWARLARPSAVTFNTATTRRGFTGHEQLDAAGLVHMNGRVYDPEIGRFVQADPIIQAPYNPQSLNRYSYVMNNPLGTTDPTGYVGRPKWLNYAMQAVALYITLQTGLEVSALLTNATCSAPHLAATLQGQAVLATAGGGAASGLASTGSPKGALTGAVTSLAYLGAGQLATTAGFAGDSLGRAAIHGVTGGVLSELQGGNFGHGFVQAGLGKALHSRVDTGSAAADMLMSAMIGGSIDAATGGKFASGAQSAAMQYAFNGLVSKGAKAWKALITGKDYRADLAQDVAEGADTLASCGSGDYTGCVGGLVEAALDWTPVGDVVEGGSFVVTKVKELRRPYIRKSTREAVETNAPRDSLGRPIDPNTRQPITGRPDLGHRPGHEHWREKQMAEAEGLSQREFNDRMNDPSKYQLEDPSSNRSRRYESKD